jgi:hypothetical protein
MSLSPYPFPIYMHVAHFKGVFVALMVITFFPFDIFETHRFRKPC